MLANVHDGFYLRERETDHRCQADLAAYLP